MTRARLKSPATRPVALQDRQLLRDDRSPEPVGGRFEASFADPAAAAALDPDARLARAERLGHRLGAGQVLQPKLENESINNPVALGEDLGSVQSYAGALSDAVEQGRSLVATKYFVHVPPADGYMSALVDNFDVDTNAFRNGRRMPRQAGYWIESYATKVESPAAGGGLDVLTQAKRGKSRPDVVLQQNGMDLAWLDITSEGSKDHIYSKDSDGWFETPYVTEVTYTRLKLNELNSVAVPDESSQDLSALLEKAAQAQQKTLDWEASIIEKHGLWFAVNLLNLYTIVKGHAVEVQDQMWRDEEVDMMYDPLVEGNEYERYSVNYFSEKLGQTVTPRELAAALMYMGGAVARYENRFNSTLPDIYKVETKDHIGLKWIKDVSSADGEPILRDWFGG